MPALSLSNAHYGRPRVNLPSIRLVNAYIESSGGGPSSEVRVPRPGLTAQYQIGTGPILRCYREAGLFNGDPFFVSGGKFYRAQTFLGNVAFTQNPRIAAANGQISVVSGGGLYVYNGTTFTQIQFFNDGVSRLPPFSSVAVLYNIFIFTVLGSNQFFFSSVGDPTTINAANFSSAQVNPSNILEVATVGEELYFFKAQDSVEIWDFTGNLTAPFAESQGRTYAHGCAAQNSVVQLDNSLFWVGDDFTVYRSSSVPLDIATPVINDRLRAAGHAGLNQMTAFTCSSEGHVFYVMNLPTLNESYAYDCQTKQWAQWGTEDGVDPEPGVFQGQVSCGVGDQTFIGSRNTNDVYLLDVANNTDNNLAKRVVVSGAIWIEEGVQRINNVSLHCVRGVATTATPNPIVSMRYSDDGGRTFSSWSYGQLGMIGQYAYKAQWRNLGIITQPGRNFEFAVADPVNFTVEGASFNSARV